MKYIVEHYGPALVAIAIMVTLAGLIVGMLSGDGVIAKEFSDAVTTFFAEIKSAAGM